MTTTDTQPHYSAHLLHFAAVHWLELESRGDDVRHEYSLLDIDAGELCLCGTKWATSGEVGRRAPNTAVAWSPGSLRLDLQVAYAALPLRWQGRTHVHLLLLDNPYTEQQVWALRRQEEQHGRPGEWTARHRRRIATETFLRADYPRPQDGESETMSPWRWMADYLSGKRTELRRAA